MWPIPRSVAIVGPGYFPDVRTAAYLLAAERVIVADVVQYSRQSRQNRCRIRTPDGAHWLTIPLRGGQHGTAHNRVELDAGASWTTRHRKAFEFNYRSSPYFDHHDRAVWEVLDESAQLLGDVTVRSVQATATMLGAAASVEAASDLPRYKSNVAPTRLGAPVRWGDVVSATIAAYPLMDVLLVERWVLNSGVDVRVATGSIEVVPLEYEQNFPSRIPGLSVLDVIFNVGPEARRLVEAAMNLVE